MSSRRRAAECLLAFLILLTGGGISPGQDAPPEKDPELLALDVKVGQFLREIAIGETPSAYQDLLAGSRLLKQEKALRALIEKTQQLDTKYGRHRGSEQIAAKRIGSDLVLLRYLYKCEDYPVVWYFTFYRTPALDETPLEKTPWRVVSVRFDTELERLAE